MESLGLVAYMTGSRPSAMINWDDPDEWLERISFDTMVMAPIAKKVLVGK